MFPETPSCFHHEPAAEEGAQGAGCGDVPCGGDIPDLGPAFGQLRPGDDGDDVVMEHFGVYDAGDDDGDGGRRRPPEDVVREALRPYTASGVSEGAGEGGGGSVPVIRLTPPSQSERLDETSRGFWTCCYPVLFPWGTGDISVGGGEAGFRSSGNQVDDYASWFRRLIWHPSGRFSAHPTFAFHVSNVIQRRQMRSKSVNWVKAHPLAKDPTVAELLELESGVVSSFLKSVLANTGGVKGTNEYWRDVRRRLHATVRHISHFENIFASFFVSGSCAENWHPSMLTLVADAVERSGCPRPDVFAGGRLGGVARRKLVKDHGHIVCAVFEARTRRYVAEVLRPSWGVCHHFVRFEFAEGRGQIHFHAIFWRSDGMPHGLCSRSASEQDFLDALESFFTELGFTCEHPAGADKTEWAPPEGTKTHANDADLLLRPFEQLLTLEGRIDLANLLCLHGCSGYCIRLRLGGCRFGFGGSADLCAFEGLPGLFGQKPLSDRFSVGRDHRGHLVARMKRGHPRILQHCPAHFRTWGANMDHSVLVSLEDHTSASAESWALLDYVVGYATKGNPSGEVDTDLFLCKLRALSEENPDLPRSSVVRALMTLAVGSKRVPRQQVLHEYGGGVHYYSDLSVVKLSLGTSRSLAKTSKQAGSSAAGPEVAVGDMDSAQAEEHANKTVKTTPNLVDKYAAAVSEGGGCTISGGGGPPRRVLVRTLAMYDWASGPAVGQPLGSRVPEVTGMGLLRASWPVLPDFAVAMLRVFKPGFVWNGAVWSGGADDGSVRPSSVEVGLFLAFLEELDDHGAHVCPAHLRAEVNHARAKAGARAAAPRGAVGAQRPGGWLGGSSGDEEEEEELPDAQRLAEFRGGDADDCSEKLSPPRVLVGGLGSDDYGRITCSASPPVVPPAEAGSWFSGLYRKHADARRASVNFAAGSWTRADLMKANPEQRVAIVGVLATLQSRLAGEAVPPLRALVSGTAGTGKSWVIRAITHLVDGIHGVGSTLNSAPTGCAADLIGAKTIHSSFGIGVMSSAKPADSTALASSALQGRLRPAHVIQIDERSMVSAKLLGHVDHQCRVACSPDESFGAVPVVLLYGDDAQLGPVCSKPRIIAHPPGDHLCDPHTTMARNGVDLYWTSFRDCVALKKMARFVTAPCTACSAEFHPPEADCDFLPNLLHRMRFSACTRRDLEWVNHLTLDAISARDPARRALFDGDSTLYLVPKKSQAHDINSSRFERLQQASGRWGCGIRARDGTDAGRAGAGRPASGDDEFGGLPARTWLTPGALVVVTTNLAQDWRVFNGAVGTVVDIIFAEGSTPSVDGAPEDWPLLVLVDLPGYTGPAYFPDRPSVVPISPVKRHEKGRWREMFPLKLGWALTFHKAQGMTIGLEQSYRRVVVDLGEESVEEWGAGLAFVGLSRPKTAGDLAFAHPVSWARLHQATHQGPDGLRKKSRGAGGGGRGAGGPAPGGGLNSHAFVVRREDARQRVMALRTSRRFSVARFEVLVDWSLALILARNTGA